MILFLNLWCHHYFACFQFTVSCLLIYFWWYNKQETVSHVCCVQAAGTGIESELISYLAACKTYVGDKGLAFWNATAAFPSLTPFAQDLLSAPASQAYVERVFSVCGYLTSGRRNRLCKTLANRAFLRMNTKFYDWLYIVFDSVLTFHLSCGNHIAVFSS